MQHFHSIIFHDLEDLIGKTLVVGKIEGKRRRGLYSAVATRLEKVSFHSNPKESNAKECSDYRTIAQLNVDKAAVTQMT